MQALLLENYMWLKAIHIIAIISWMAGMLYLPRLFVYHTQSKTGSDLDKTLQTMERKLLKFIMNPAMIVSWLLGLSMLYANPAMLQGQGWMHAKLLCVILMSGLHGMFAGMVKKFANGENKKSEKFYRVINEAPTLLMIIIVILAIIEPF